MWNIFRRVADPILTRITDRVAHKLAERHSVPRAPKLVSPPKDQGIDAAIAWDLKLYGSCLARELFAAKIQPLIDAPNTTPGPVPLTSKVCEEADFESAWFVHWCRELKMAPIYHRKVWEDCFALQAVWEACLMREGTSALVFGAGEEPLPSLLAARGVDVLATDLAADAPEAAGWIATGQHANRERLFRPDLVDHATFERRIRFRPVDMNEIPPDLEGRFDLCWSLCSLEHVGTTERAMRFVERSIDCLKPGGLAIHTTEFNLSSNTDTVTEGWCVLFTRSQIEQLCERLRHLGHEVFPVDWNPGTAPLDHFVDLPPFPNPDLTWTLPNGLSLPPAPHLRLALLGHVSTSIALIIRRGS